MACEDADANTFSSHFDVVRFTILHFELKPLIHINSCVKMAKKLN
jgi:hypothetical protein